MSRTRVVHFVVTGEAMTRAARSLLLDDEPGKAYRLLSRGLRGDGALEATLRVLAGTHDLVGDSQIGLELVEAQDDAWLRDFRKDFRFIYAGRIKRQGRWLQPVARIVCWLPQDAEWASSQVPQGNRASQSGLAAMRRWAKERARYYCASGETPELLKIDGESAYTIWEPCGELPHWMQPPRTMQEALDDALAAGRPLRERPSEAEIQLSKREAEDRTRQVRSRKEREAAAEEREREYERQLREIGEEVRAQAGDDTFELKLEDGRKLTVPRAPFVRWALARTDHSDRAPQWENVAPVGVKLSGDNPDHTDWVLGAGLTLQEAYTDAVMGVAWDRAHEFQEAAREPPPSGIQAALEMLRDTIHEAAVVVDAGERVGTVGVDIAVFPDAAAERVDELAGCVGAIIAKGGKLAHFAIVTKGRGITVMRHADACALFPEGTRVSLNPATGRIIILDETDS